MYSRLSLLLGFALTMQTITAQVKPGDLRVTIVAHQISVADLFTRIWQQTRYQAFYNDEQLGSAELLDVNFMDMPLDTVLTILLTSRNLKWYYREETFVIMPSKAVPIGFAISPPPPIVITGHVQGSNGESLRATLRVIETSQNLKTDTAGNFSFTPIGHEPLHLLIRSPGYQTARVPVKGHRLLIQLSPISTDLQEQQVMGYTRTARRYVTGSVTTVKGDVLESTGFPNVLAALEGHVTGLTSIPVSGLPGSDYRILMRGLHSFASGTQPLILLDGMPLPPESLSWDDSYLSGPNYLPRSAAGLGANHRSSNLSLVSIADIETVTVLKDADATAIYGSRGANGVILITRKLPTLAGTKTQWNASIYRGVGNQERLQKFLQTPDYLRMRREAIQQDGNIPTPGSDYDLQQWDTTRYTDWQKRLLGQAAPLLNAQVRMNGVLHHWGYLLSGNYRQEGTTFPGNFRYLQGNGLANLTHYSLHQTGWGNSQVIASYYADDNYLPESDLSDYAATPPNAPASYLPDGSLNWQSGFPNPEAALLQTYQAKGHHFQLQASQAYRLGKAFSAQLQGGFYSTSFNENQWNPRSSFNPDWGVSHSFSYFGKSATKSWLLEPKLEGELSKGDHYLQLLGGATFQVMNQQKTLGYSQTDADNRPEAPDPNGRSTLAGMVTSQYRYTGYYSRIGYRLKDRYLLNFTGRLDGSNRFGSGYPYRPFYAIGAGLIFTEINYFKEHVSWLSLGKLRFSCGLTGNDQLRDYTFTSDAIATRQRVDKSNYSWELVRKLEGGTDIYYKNWNVSMTIYRHRSSNLLLETPSVNPAYEYQLGNTDALLENKGMEWEVGYQKKRGDWTIHLQGQWSYNSNKLLTLPANAPADFSYYYTKGQAVNSFKGLLAQGVDPLTGIYQFNDYNEDGKINKADYRFSTPVGPEWYGSLSASIVYRGFHIDAFFVYVKQNGYDLPFTPGVVTGGMVNQPASIIGNYWERAGDEKPVQVFSADETGAAAKAFAYAQNSSLVLGDASYFRLRSLNLSYDLRFSSANVHCFISGQNLFTITRYQRGSPEMSGNLALTYAPPQVWMIGMRGEF